MRTGSLVLALAAAWLAPAAATAATVKPPQVKSGGVLNILQQSVRLTASLDPNGAATTYYFQYGPTKQYGMQTPPQTATGTGKRNVIADLGGLTPATKYHYRIVAMNSAGTANGADKSFTTAEEPLAVVIGGRPNPLRFGSPLTIDGQVSGTGSGGATVVVNARPFPYDGPFQPAGNPIVAGPDGRFSLPVLSVPLTTQYQAVVQGKTFSPVIRVDVSPRVGTLVRTRVRRGQRVTFRGTITPALPNTVVTIQRRAGRSGWTSVARTLTRPAGGGRSGYRRPVRIGRTGSYRVVVLVANGRFVRGTGRVVRIRTVR